MNAKNYISEFERVNRQFEQKYHARVKRAVMPSGLINMVRTQGKEAAIRFLQTWLGNEKLGEVIQEMYLEAGLRHARMNYIRMRDNPKAKSVWKEWYGVTEVIDYTIEKKQFGFNAQWTAFIKNFLQRFLLEKITFEVSETTREELLKILQLSIEKGWGVDETVKALQDSPLPQVARIVRTEVNRAANTGAKAQSETFPYEQNKTWLSARDRRVRGNDPHDETSHVGLNGVTIDSQDKFKDPRNGDLLDFPGDPEGSAASTVNCRCAVAYTAKRDAKENLIPKRTTTSVLIRDRRRNRQRILV